MIKIDSVHAGTHVRFRVTTYNSSNVLTDTDSLPNITIYSGEPEFDTEELEATAMAHSGTGIYDYWWDTTGLATDTYLAVVPTTVNTRVYNNRFQLRVLSATV